MQRRRKEAFVNMLRKIIHFGSRHSRHITSQKDAYATTFQLKLIETEAGNISNNGCMLFDSWPDCGMKSEISSPKCM